MRATNACRSRSVAVLVLLLLLLADAAVPFADARGGRRLDRSEEGNVKPATPDVLGINVLAVTYVDDLRAPTFDLLVDAFRVLARAMWHLNVNYDVINVDGSLTGRMVSEQLQILRNHIRSKASPLYTEAALQAIVYDMDFIIDLGKNLSTNALVPLEKNNKAYLYELWSLTQKKAWLIDYPTRVTNPSLVFKDRNLNYHINGPTSDRCIDELTGYGPVTVHPCKPSDFCWNYMTTPGTGNYYITHQLFYHLIGKMAGCEASMKRMIARFKQISVEHLIEIFCANIKQEMIENEVKIGIPDSSANADIGMEQIFFCGMVGYKDFMSKRWLKAILKLPMPEGCFGMTQLEAIFVQLTHLIKRTENSYKGSCLSHATGVGVGVLGQYIRYLIEDPNLFE